MSSAQPNGIEQVVVEQVVADETDPARDTDPAREPRRLVVAAALVDDLSHPSLLLAARRTEPSALAGGWEFAGGKVEPGESPLEALHREIGEELGVRIELGRHLPGPLAGGTWELGNRYEMLVWLARVTEGTAAPLEDHDALQWLGADELYSVDWLPADLPIVAEVERLLA